MKQTRMFKDETIVARKLLKATYALALTVLKMEYSDRGAAVLIKNNFYSYYFSIDRHNKMIGGA